MNRTRLPLAGTIVGYTRNGRPVLAIAGADQRGALLERRDSILARLENPGDLSPDDLAGLTTEAEEVRGQIDAYNTAADAASTARAALLGTETRAVSRPGTAVTPPAGTTDHADAPDMRPAGQRVVEHAAFAAFRERGFTGQVAIDLPTLHRATIDTGATSAGAFANPARPTEVPMTYADRALRVADLIDRRPTDGTTVEYVREDTAAGAGSTAAETAEGAVKPEATFTFAVVTDTVRTIAHWVNITRQAAEDNAQVRGYIEGRLAYGVDYRLDAQIINGNGTSPNLRGILNTAGIGTYVAPASEAAVLSVRKAITVAQQSEYAPDTLVCSPLAWERIELSRDNDGMFRVSPNVSNSLAPRIWGLNVVPLTSIADATGLVGSMRMGATLWEREGVRVLMTDSHASNFTSNILTLLAEMRAALSVWRPKAFVKITFDAAGL